MGEARDRHHMAACLKKCLVGCRVRAIHIFLIRECSWGESMVHAG